MNETATYETRLFGPITPEPADVLHFGDGLVGMPGLRRFALIEHAPDSPFVWLQSLDDPDFAVLAVEPSVYVPDYDPAVPAADAARLGLHPEDSYIVYTLVTIPRGRPEAMTLNLAGPILVHTRTKQARQVVVDGDGWEVRHPAFGGIAQAAA
jgi:flagellar assembly factor FliW